MAGTPWGIAQGVSPLRSEIEMYGQVSEPLHEFGALPVDVRFVDLVGGNARQCLFQ